MSDSTPNRLKGKTAIVTGGARGIGEATVRRLAADGAQVVFSWAHSEELANELVREITAAGQMVSTVKADSGNPDEIRGLFEWTESEIGPIDIVVNNGGIGWDNSIAEMPLSDFEQLIQVNLIGTFVCLQEAARRVRDYGRIITISSGHTRRISAGAGPLSATKAGIEELTKALALEVASRRVTVNSVRPNLIESTGITPEVRENIKDLIAAVPLGGLGQTYDVANTIAFLASDDARWITGSIIDVNGGL
jgi:Dehydrogenases with different specificities (related to short-chain alcohol dehydrogenases)